MKEQLLLRYLRLKHSFIDKEILEILLPHIEKAIDKVIDREVFTERGWEKIEEKLKRTEKYGTRKIRN